MAQYLNGDVDLGNIWGHDRGRWRHQVDNKSCHLSDGLQRVCSRSHNDRDHPGAHNASDDSGSISRSRRGMHRAFPSCACTGFRRNGVR